MEKRCFNCANARANKCQWVRSLGMGMPATLTCLQPYGAPGQMREVLPNGTCPNFRPKPQPPLRVEPPEPTIPGTALIPLTKGLHALVDAADAEWLSKYKWHALVAGDRVYAARHAGGGVILMHREIMQPPPGMQVDHKEHDGIDNRRESLRVCTPEENSHNTRSHGGASGLKGVSPCGDKWLSRICFRGERLYLGLYDDPVEAAKVRDRKALELQGPFAYLNFPEIREEMKAEDGGQRTEGRRKVRRLQRRMGRRRRSDGGSENIVRGASQSGFVRRSSGPRAGSGQVTPMIQTCLWGDRRDGFSAGPAAKASSSPDRIDLWGLDPTVVGA